MHPKPKITGSPAPRDQTSKLKQQEFWREGCDPKEGLATPAVKEEQSGPSKQLLDALSPASKDLLSTLGERQADTADTIKTLQQMTILRGDSSTHV